VPTDLTEQKATTETKEGQTFSKETTAMFVTLRRVVKDEYFAHIERTINRRSDFMLAIAGGTFAALIASGQIKPQFVSWQTKILLVALALSSLLGVIVKFFWQDRISFASFRKTEIEKLTEVVEKEVGEDSEKAVRLCVNAANNRHKSTPSALGFPFPALPFPAP
jgi:hypothetical protein